MYELPLFLVPEQDSVIAVGSLAEAVNQVEQQTGKFCLERDCSEFPDPAYKGQATELRQISCIAIQSAAGCEGCGFDRSNEAIGDALRNPVIDEDLRVDGGDF